MKLYHESNQAVEKPQIIATVRGLDFVSLNRTSSGSEFV
jgi:hypothetical protein